MVLMVENDGRSGPFCPGIPISYSLKVKDEFSNEFHISFV